MPGRRRNPAVRSQRPNTLAPLDSMGIGLKAEELRELWQRYSATDALLLAMVRMSPFNRGTASASGVLGIL
jgi:hypothetical protein